MKGLWLTEVGKIVNAGPPVDINGAGLDGVYANMANYGHLTAIVKLGVTGAATTITVEKDADGSGAGTAIAFRYRKEDTDSGDTLDALTSVAASGVACSTNNNIFYVIELDAAELGEGYPYVRVRLSDPTVATLADITYVLTGARYQQATPPTALAV
jgi:hypothetical protein